MRREARGLRREGVADFLTPQDYSLVGLTSFDPPYNSQFSRRAMPTRVLVAIPHFFDDDPSRARHGSCRQTRDERAAILRAVVASLHETFSPLQCLFDLSRRRARPACAATHCDLHVLIHTAGGKHVLDALDDLRPYFEHIPTGAEPRMLGFECHRAMADRVDAYDYYVYLEDDLLVGDPLFFVKQDHFREQFGQDAVLSPNRFERKRSYPLVKAYIDGPLASRFRRALREPSAVGQVVLEGFGPPVVLRRPDNPHAGCFVLSREQMTRWSRRRYFLDGDTRFVSPLESAATLGVARTFAVYKPAVRWASFLEVEHCGSAYIDRLTHPQRLPAANAEDAGG